MVDSVRTQRWLRAVVGLLALAAIVFGATGVVVGEGQAVLVTRFGRPLRAATQPGLHWKLPWPIDQAVTLDMRRRIYETGQTEMLTRDKKNVIARSFIIWRIGDPLTFTQAIGNENGAEGKLDGLMTNAAIGALGGHDLSALVSTNTADLQVDQIESELLASTGPVALHNYGVSIEQIRFERIALPEANVTAVFAQMRAERRQFAAKFQAEGQLEASRIRSEAELEAARITAKGAEEEARIRGESAAQVAKIYADAHRVDPELYRFTRSLESLNKLVTPSTSLILRTDSEPFSLLPGQGSEVRHKGPPSEISRLLEPMARVLDQAWRRMHWWIATMVVLYAFSGITVVRSDEAAVILRWGRLVGSTPALQEHGPGLLFAFPRPMDRVVRVQVKHVYEVPVGMLAASGDDDEDSSGENTLNPLTEGYAVTGDHNIVQVSMVARYRVRNPAEWAFYGPKAEEVLRVETTAAMVRSLGEMAIDRILAEGRKDLIATATRRAQEGLDAAHSGLELSSLELTAIAPPAPLAKDFDAVQSAYIGAETMKNSAQAFGERAIPDAQAKANAAVQSARSAADSELALARGSAQAFHALEQEYRTNRAVVRERLYRDAVEQALSTASQVRWIPPPVGKTYHGFRIEVSVPKAGTRSTAPSNPAPRAATSPAPVPSPASATASPIPPKPVVPAPDPEEEAP